MGVCVWLLELHEAAETQLEDSEQRADSLTRDEIYAKSTFEHSHKHTHKHIQTAMWQDDSVCGAHATGKSLNWNKLTIMCVARNGGKM